MGIYYKVCGLSIILLSSLCPLRADDVYNISRVTVSPKVGYGWCEEIIEEMIQRPEDSIKCMLKIKKVVENVTGNVIDLDKYIHDMNSMLKSRGQGFTKNEIKMIKEEISKYSIPSIYNQMFNISDTVTAQDIIDRINDREKNKKVQQKVNKVPARISAGISFTLSGMFLYCIPNPAAQVAGQRIAELGILMIIDGYINMDEKEEEKKVKDIRKSNERNDDPNVIDIRQR
jgi:hypothetical protein